MPLTLPALIGLALPCLAYSRDAGPAQATSRPQPVLETRLELGHEGFAAFRAEDQELVLENTHLRLRYNLTTARFALEELSADQDDGKAQLLLEGAEPMALSHLLVPAHIWPGHELEILEWSDAPVSTALGPGHALTVTTGGQPDYPTFTQTFVLPEDGAFLLSDVTVINRTKDEIFIGAIYPIYAAPPEGALYLGADKDLRVLTNGALNYLDFIAPILPGTVGTISNWSTLIYNQSTGKSFSLGYLTYYATQPVVYNGPARDGESGQELHTACEFDPNKALAPGESLTSETMILDASGVTPFDALETYAERMTTWLSVTPWMERHPEVGVPVGWNSWSGGGSSGGYGTDINEEIILDNMEFADRELRRWGMNYFQIDDGWETAIGDWVVNTDRFPDHGDMNGIEWLMDQAHQRGFLTGLWIQAFGAEAGAEILEEHPEWFADYLMPDPSGANGKLLDLSDPEALEYLVGIVNMLEDWGIDWFKLDFAYEAYLSENWDDETLTRAEYYRQGVQTVKGALEEDTFFLNVAIVGLNYDLADGIRLTLDTMPVWDGEQPLDPITNQGLKPMYRDSVRRYYLHGRPWVNHPDLILFRAHRDTQYPPLTLNESVTFATSVALQGGLVKLGDRLVDLEPDQVDAIRRIIPPYAIAGRPLDLFEREYPEKFSLPVPDFPEPYHLLGLLNWGENRDLTTMPHAVVPDRDRTIAVDLEAAGLEPGRNYLAYEFWEEEYLGIVDRRVSLQVPARTARVVALRPMLGRPQLLGTNRHVLGGIKVIQGLNWDPNTLRYSGVQEASVGTEHSPFTFHLAFFVPLGLTFDGVDFVAPEGIDVRDVAITSTNVDQGYVLRLEFSVANTDEPRLGDPFARLTWTLSFFD